MRLTLSRLIFLILHTPLMKKIFLTLFGIGVLRFSLQAAPAIPPEIPVETLFQVPAMSGVEFSPDGNSILALVPYERRQNLAVIDLVKGAKNLLSNFKDKQAISPFWASNDRILFFVDKEGDEVYELFAVNQDGSDPSNLVTGKNMSLLRRIKGDTKNILVMAGITHSDWMDVANMNLKTGKLSVPIAKAPGDVDYYVLDHQNVVRMAIVTDLAARTRKVLYREANKQPWQELAAFAFDAPNWTPLAFDGDNRTLFVRTNMGRKTDAIFRYDTVTQTWLDMVHGDDTYDVTGLIFDDFKKKVVGVTYEGDRRRFHWIDPEMAAIHKNLEQALPDTVHYPVQFSEDGSKIIFLSYSDRDPGVYYIYDRKRQKLSELAVLRPKIDPEQMAHMKPVTYKARDGLTLHGYLTLPVGRDPKNLPVIIHPHGGPYGPRDEWGYNPEVQFYANRGFAVLQVNFRGSGGYGDWFEAAGFKKWGLEMQDDLTDGVKWLVDQGIADPKRVVISGASYGGYATMAGLVYTPELYVAGINYVGVVDINNLLPKGAPPSRLYWYNTRIADLSKSEDRKRLHDTSPVNFADRIRVPLLMAYGKNDPRVPINQAYDIERALKRANVPYELIIEKDEGHGFYKEETSIAFYSRIDAFLKRHVLNKTGDPSTKIPDFQVLESPAKADAN